MVMLSKVIHVVKNKWKNELWLTPSFALSHLNWKKWQDGQENTLGLLQNGNLL